MVIKGHSVGVRNEKQVIGNWKKGNPGYKVVKNMSRLCSSVLGKIEIMNGEIAYLAEEIPKQNIGGVT